MTQGGKDPGMNAFQAGMAWCKVRMEEQGECLGHSYSHLSVHRWARLRQDGHDGESGGLGLWGQGPQRNQGLWGLLSQGVLRARNKGSPSSFFFLILPDPASSIWIYHHKAVLKLKVVSQSGVDQGKFLIQLCHQCEDHLPSGIFLFISGKRRLQSVH